MERGRHPLEPLPAPPAEALTKIPPSPQATSQTQGPAEIREGDRLHTLPLPGKRASRAALARDVRCAAALLDRQLSQRYPIVDLPPTFDLGGEA